jgi:predicted permease
MRLEHWNYIVPLRLRSLLHRKQVDQELDDELQYHLDRKIEQYLAEGLTPKEAQRSALRDMQGLTQRKEECRDARGVTAIDDTVRDVRYGLRILLKSLGFTVTAILTLALAIGANSVVFGILNGLILRPLNVPDGKTLYGIEYGDGSPCHSYPNYVDLRSRNHSFQDLAAYNFAFVGLDTGKEAAPVVGFAVSGNYFDLLKLSPSKGRFFHNSDEHGENSASYVVLSYDFWQSHFLSDPNVIGRKIGLNKHPFTVIGVAPPGFHGTLSFIHSDLFLPMVNQAQVNAGFTLTARGNNDGIFETFGHLKPGVTPSQAVADLDAVGASLRKTYPKEVPVHRSTLSRSGLTSFTRGAKAFVAGLMLLAGLILIAACANLGALFGAHTADRSREIALRLALGSGRGRIVRQLLTEAVLVSLIGGLAGLLGGVVLLRQLSHWQPFHGAPVHIPVVPDARVYLVALALALVSGFLFGIVPSAKSSGPTHIRSSRRDQAAAREAAWVCAMPYWSFRSPYAPCW